jgi:hypothetical protein
MHSLAQLESSTLELGDNARRYLGPQIRLRSTFISLQTLYVEGENNCLLPGNIIRWLVEGFAVPAVAAAASRKFRCLRANSAGLFAGVMTGRSVNGICGRGS